MPCHAKPAGEPVDFGVRRVTLDRQREIERVDDVDIKLREADELLRQPIHHLVADAALCRAPIDDSQPGGCLHASLLIAIGLYDCRSKGYKTSTNIEVKRRWIQFLQCRSASS
jgi:hypothetical protein